MKGLLLSAQSWWLSISQREQRLVLACSVVAIIGIIYWGILAPFAQRTENAQMRIQSERQLLSWVSEQADTIVEKTSCWRCGCLQAAFKSGYHVVNKSI